MSGAFETHTRLQEVNITTIGTLKVGAKYGSPPNRPHQMLVIKTKRGH